MKTAPVFVALVVGAFAAHAFGQTIELVADLELTTVPISSNPMGDSGDFTVANQPPFVEAGGRWYFTAETVAEGRELWSTDGTTAGTALVADIYPNGHANPAHLAGVGNTLFFLADDGVHGRELWKTDGTTAGTVLVKDINPGAASTDADNLVAFQGQLYFAADGPTTGKHLWRSDGTAAGTQLFAQIGVAESSAPKTMRANAADTLLYFFADDGVHGLDPWVTDGTHAGTLTLGDLDAGSPFLETSLENNFHELNGQMLFAAFHPSRGRELWVSDGTPAGTSFVSDLQPGQKNGISTRFDAVEYGGELYFSGWYSGGVNTLWKTDGTSAGTVRLTSTGIGTESLDPTCFSQAGGKLYYLARNQFSSAKVHVFDGTTAKVAIDLGGSQDFTFKEYDSLVGGNGTLYFRASSSFSGDEVWTSDGTQAGTVELTNVSSLSTDAPIANLTPLPNGGCLFITTLAGDRELWASGGTVATTGVLADLEPGLATLSSDPEDLVSFDGHKLFFTAHATGAARRPYVLDATPSATLGATVLGPPAADAELAMRFQMAWLGDHAQVVFGLREPATGMELWTTDGTPAGTQLVKDIKAGSGGSFPDVMSGDGQRLYFSASDGAGNELWATDGSALGTAMVTDLNPGSASSFVDPLGFLSGRFVFSARTANEGDELWVSDGTVAGTVLLADIWPGPNGSDPRQGITIDGKFYFNAQNGVLGDELWVTDGTPAGTMLLHDVLQGTPSSFPHRFVRFGKELLFEADLVGNGTAFWRTDFVSAPRRLIVGTEDFFADPEDDRLVVSDNVLYFAFKTAAEGVELWRSDGSVAGTSLVLNIMSGAGDSRPRDFVAAEGGAYFTADDGVHGRELWFTDGTAAGTAMVADLRTGAPWSDPDGLTLVEGDLYFAATNDYDGRELFRLVDAGAYARSLGAATPGGQVTMTTPQLGTPIRFRVEELPAGDVGFLLMSLATAAPTVYHTQSGYGTWIDPISLQLLAPFTGPGGIYVTTPPANPSLTGLILHFQVVHSATGQPPYRTTNALQAVLGG